MPVPENKAADVVVDAAGRFIPLTPRAQVWAAVVKSRSDGKSRRRTRLILQTAGLVVRFEKQQRAA